MNTEYDMSRRPLPEPSRSELEILQDLWKHGASTVREVHDRLHPASGWAYTTIKTIMDRMAVKSLVLREAFHGIYLYRAAVSRPAGLARWIHYFAGRILETDVSNVVALFAQGHEISKAELEELKRLIAQIEKEES